MDSNRNDIGSRNESVNLSGLSLFELLPNGNILIFISEIKEQLQWIVLLPFVDPSKPGTAPRDSPEGT
jgi:hypothetical protein